MEVQEETMALVIKGKRTKRPRPNSPLTLPMVSTSSSAVESERFSDNSCPTTSFDFATTSTEEEEDMANCLILLAQGRSFERKVFTDDDHHHQLVENYQCKTCNRCFSSFQALGGHRASHKKPKNVNEEKKTLLVIKEDEDHISQMSTALSLQLSNRASLCVSNNVKVNKVHECSICGAEFSSGQALGGHMRRHRAFISNNTTTSTALSIATSNDHHHHHHLAEAKRKRNLLHLDLNLPAPEDDCRESKFSFSSKEQVIVFSASSLVDCHY